MAFELLCAGDSPYLIVVGLVNGSGMIKLFFELLNTYIYVPVVSAAEVVNGSKISCIKVVVVEVVVVVVVDSVIGSTTGTKFGLGNIFFLGTLS